MMVLDKHYWYFYIVSQYYIQRYWNNLGYLSIFKPHFFHQTHKLFLVHHFFHLHKVSCRLRFITFLNPYISFTVHNFSIQIFVKRSVMPFRYFLFVIFWSNITPSKFYYSWSACILILIRSMMRFKPSHWEIVLRQIHFRCYP